jgi:guanylate kinase
MSPGTVRHRLVFVVFGAGGVGKGTLVERLLELRDGLWLSRSWTTRPRRPSEPAGAYVFVSREEFMARVAAGGFSEWTEFQGNGHLYGTPALGGQPWPGEPGAPEGKDVVLEIDLDGAKQIKAQYPGAVLIFVVAPSADEQLHRLHWRGDDEASIAKRLEVGAEEERAGRQLADHVVVNDDLERAGLELAAIVDQWRKKVS